MKTGIVLLLLFFMQKNINAQFLDKLSNPTVSINLKHPPGLGLKINKIAFGPATGKCSDEIIDAIIADFVENQIEVIDRQNLSSVLNEHKLSLSGYIDQSSASAIGKILGPSALIFVKVQRCETITDKLYDTETKYDYKSKSEYKVTVYYTRTRAFLKASIQTVDLATGRIFAAKSMDFSPEKKNKSYEGYPEAPTEFDVSKIAFDSMVTEVHRMFLPWTERTDLIYYDDNKCELKQAFQAFKIEDFDRAFDISVQKLDACKSMTDVKEKTLGHAYYNVGMSYMVKSEYDSALAYFKTAAQLRPGDVTTKAIADCQRAIEMKTAMQKIEQKATLDAGKKQADEKLEAANMLSNSDVIQMVKQKLSDGIIIQKIKKSKCKFNTSTDALGLLSKAGVSEQVIMVMMEQ